MGRWLRNYTLSTADGYTFLTVEIDVTPQHKDYFLTTWPKALTALKKLSERVD